MELFDYRNFLMNEGSKEGIDLKFDVKDVVQAIAKIASKVVEKDSRVMTTIMVYLEDRPSQSVMITDHIKNLGIDVDVQRGGKDVEFVLDAKKIRIKYKPTGGQAATTYHSTISEIIPCLLWETKYSGSADPVQIVGSIFEKYGEDLDGLSSSPVFVSAGDADSAKNALFAMRADVETGAKIPNEKIGIGWKLYEWIKSHNGTSDFYKRVDYLVWAYRTKPFDIYKKSTADVVVASGNMGAYGISIKAASTVSEKIRMGSTAVYEMIKDSNLSSAQSYLDNLIQKAWEQVYQPIFQQQLGDEYENFMKSHPNFNKEYCAERSKTKQEAASIINEWGKNNPKDILPYADKLSVLVKEWLCDLINREPDLWANALYNLSGISATFPVIVLIGSAAGVTEVSSDDKEVFKGNIKSTAEGGGFNARIATKNTIGFDITENHKKWEARVWTDKGNVGSIEQLSDRMVNFRIEPKS
jgi:hypothetical protein